MRLVLTILAIALTLGNASAQDSAPRFERWYRVERDGEAIGWMSLIEHETDKIIVTESAYEERTLVFGHERVFRVEGRVEETRDGRVIRRSLSENGRELASSARSVSSKEERASDAGPLAPSAAAHFIAMRLRAGADRIMLDRVDPLIRAPSERLVLTGVAPCAAVIDGREIEGFCADWGVNGRVMLDARGYPIRAEFFEGARRVVFRATSRVEATAPFESSDSVASAIMPVVVLFSYPYPVSEWRYKVSRADGKSLTLPGSIGVYSFKEDEGALIISRGASEPVALSQEEHATALRETELISFSGVMFDPPPKGEGGSVKRARELERFVYDRISRKGYGLRLVSSATAWRLREGDCTEHAVLLAAMLRREGIPARVVGGLIMIRADHGLAMTQHLWVQAYVKTPGGFVWVDLDATLEPGAEEPVRIALGATGVTDETVEDLVRRLGSLAGLLRVEAITPE